MVRRRLWAYVRGRREATTGATAAAPATVSRYVPELDMLRALAALAVVVIHVTAGLLSNDRSVAFWWAAALNQAARFSIGAFVFISGFALVRAHGTGPFAVGAYYARRVRTVLLPYVAWSACYVLWVARVEQRWTGLPGRFALDLLTGNAMYHLYFVVLIVQFYLLFPLIQPLPGRRWFGGAVLAALAVQVALDAASFYHPGGLVRYSDRLLPWWAGYFGAGAWAAARADALRRAAAGRWPVLAAAGAAAALGWMLVEFALYVRSPHHSVAWAASEFRPSAVVYTLLACATVLAAGARGWLRWGQGLLREVGRCSFGIYLAHPLVLSVVQALAAHVALRPVSYFGAAMAVTVVGAYGVTCVLGAVPGLACLVGLGVRPARTPSSRGRRGALLAPEPHGG